MAESQKERRVVIVGAGFAGFNAARELSRLIGATTEIVVINSTDYFLYLPLMPQVTGGLVESAHICVSLASRLRLPARSSSPSSRWGWGRRGSLCRARTGFCVAGRAARPGYVPARPARRSPAASAASTGSSPSG